MEGFSGAELAAIAHEASMLAIRGFVTGGRDPEDAEAVEAATVEQAHLDEAFEKVRDRSEAREEAAEALRSVS